MLSRWRKMAREGVIVTKGLEIEKDVTAELKALREMKHKYERLQVEHDLLLSHRVHFGSKTDIFAFITHHQEVCSVRTMCHLSGAESLSIMPTLSEGLESSAGRRTRFNTP